MRKLPPLNALKAFEAAARLGGVRAACQELHVTQSAISHHITNLEQHLQTTLFHRVNNRIILTETGQLFLRQIEPALDAIARATADASKHTSKETITVAMPSSLTLNWLIPRLGNFLTNHPELDIRLLEQLSISGSETDIDCAIEYRQQPSKDLISLQVLPDIVAPMASPGYIRRHKIKSVEDLKSCTLIVTERRLVSWQTILKDMSWLKSSAIISVASSVHALAAAKEGLGIALANPYNGQQFIDDKVLKIPFHFKAGSLPPTSKYYFSTLPTKSQLPKVATFKEWLIKELEKTRKEIAKNNPGLMT